jgi:hypothetical protein
VRHWQNFGAAVAVVALVAVHAETATAGLRTGTERVLQKASRGICRGLDLSCKKKTRKARPTASQDRASSKRAARPKAKTAQKNKVAPKKTEVASKPPSPPVQPPPLPKAKPQTLANTGSKAPAPPAPRAKPATTQAPIPAVPEPKPEIPTTRMTVQAPQPEPKPDVSKTPVTAQAPEPKPKPEAPKTQVAVQTPGTMPPAASPVPPDLTLAIACRSKLASLGVSFEAINSPIASGSCSVANPVKLAALKLPNAAIDFPDGPTLNCEFAVQFVEWLRDTGAPIVRAQANSPVAKLWTGPGYECRGRNGDAAAKTSEHGFGNAVDITNLKLEDGRMLEVKEALTPSSPAYATLKGLRGSACGYFTTVLGPGANAAHETHFHFDAGKHGKSDNYKICE